MDWLFLLALGLVLFLARDALLLSALERGAAWKASAAYAAVFLGVFVALGTAADFVSREVALGLLRDARLWVPAVLLHILLGIAFATARQRDRPERALGLVLVPPPVFLYCAGGLCWLALATGLASNATIGGAAIGCLWIALALGGSRWAGRARRNSEEKESGTKAILDFAAAANLSVILLLPLSSFSPQSALADTAVPWQATLMALAATAGLIGASFLYHRLRREP